MNAKIIQARGRGKTYVELVHIALNNISLAFKFVALIFYNIHLIAKDPITPTLKEVFSNCI